MPNYNKVLLMGNLTRDVELKYTPTTNTAVAKLGLAVNRRYKGNDGELKEETTFVDCEAWGNTAENLSKWFSKGKPVFLEGRLKLDTWQDKDGSNRSKLKVVVENFQFVETKGGGGNTGEVGGSAPRQANKPQAAYTGSPASSGSHEPLGEEDIPF